MKKALTYFFLSLTLLFLIPESSNAQIYPGGPTDPRDQADEILGMFDVTMGVNNTTYYRLCEIRRFFCGYTKMVMISIAVFAMGVLLLIGKLDWSRALIIVTGIAIFMGAETLAINMTRMPPNLGVIYACYCFDSLYFDPGAFGQDLLEVLGIYDPTEP